jgi:hypothetical protein
MHTQLAREFDLQERLFAKFTIVYWDDIHHITITRL